MNDKVTVCLHTGKYEYVYLLQNAIKSFILGNSYPNIELMIIETGKNSNVRKWIENLGWFEDQHEIVKALGAFMVSFFVGVLAYLIMYFLFGYVIHNGGGGCKAYAKRYEQVRRKMYCSQP